MDVVPVSLDCNDDKREEELRELFGSHGVEVKPEAPYHVLVDEPLGWASLVPQERQWSRCIVLSHNRCPAYQLDLLDLQPAALITSSTVKTWLQTLASVGRGQRSYPEPSTPLTRMERRTLQLVARGHTNGEIATQRGVSEGTVKNALSTIYQKLYLKSRVQAALYYYGHWHLLVDWSPPPHIQRRQRVLSQG